MDKMEIIDFIRMNPAMQLATVDEQGDPRTRGMMLYSVDEKGIIFHTGKFKDLYRQLKKNGRVEVSFYNPEKFVQIRVQGRAVEIDDPAFREKVVNTPGREFLKPIVEAKGIDIIRIFRVEECCADVWGMQMNQEYPRRVVEF